MDPNYFVKTHGGITAFILVNLFYLLPAGLMWPNLLPPLGPITDLFLSFITNYNTLWWLVYRLAMYVHVIETLLALLLCIRYQLNIRTTCKWIASVFINGGFSLYFLVKPECT